MVSKIEKMVITAEWLCRDANVGYDQWNRWDFPKDGDTEYAGETDCSALVYYCAKMAGYPVAYSTNRYTGTELADFQAAGFKLINAAAFTENDLKRGDILYKSGHTAIWTGSAIAEAYGDENNGSHSGQAGDQLNGTDIGETRLSPWRGGWLWVLRPPEEKTPVIWPHKPSDDMKPCDFIIEEGANGAGVENKQVEYSYRWEKWASGKLVVYISDYFNGGKGAIYGKAYFIDKVLDFPEDVAFIEPPRIVGIVPRADYNLLSASPHEITERGCKFYIYGAAQDIPRFSLDACLVGSWK